MGISNAQRLADLIRTFVAGKPMPETIKTANRAAAPLAEWLTGLQHDRSQFDRHEASLIDVAARPAQVNKVALTFRARLADSKAVRGSTDQLAQVGHVVTGDRLGSPYTRAAASEVRADTSARVALAGSSETASP